MDILLASHLHHQDHETLVYVPRFTHRLALTKAWAIEPGKRILDIGCGQGESCLALALDLGNSGHVTGIDPGQLDYGTPFTIKESQDHIKNSPLGSRITFIQTDAASLLKSPGSPPGKIFDAAVLCHSLWYFSSQESVISIFQIIAAAGISYIYLAEYSFHSSDANQVPHILAAKAQALFHAYKTPRESGIHELNVRAAPDQESIIAAAQYSGFELYRHGIITPEETMLEGHFEARHVAADSFRKRVAVENLPAEQEAEILALALRTKEEMEKLNKRGVLKVRAMDVWWAVLKLNE